MGTITTVITITISDIHILCTKVDPGDTTLKAINGNFDYNCATIDRRGLQNNVESADCDEKTGYICEFRPDENGDPPENAK